MIYLHKSAINYFYRKIISLYKIQLQTQSDLFSLQEVLHYSQRTCTVNFVYNETLQIRKYMIINEHMNRLINKRWKLL